MVSERVIKQRAYADAKLREKWQAQQQAKLIAQTFFPSTLPGSRGAVSPLGGVAQPAPKQKWEK